jgi:hypothetical protein
MSSAVRIRFEHRANGAGAAWQRTMAGVLLAPTQQAH